MLVELTRFLGLFFASAPGVSAGGEGGVSDGGAPPAGGGGGESIPDAGEVDSGVPDESVPDGEAPPEGESIEPAPTAGKTAPLAQKLNKLAKEHPEIPELQALYKEIRGESWTLNTYRETFATPQEAQEARNFLDEIGGREGYEDAKSSLAEQDEINGKYYSRDAGQQREYIRHVIQNDRAAFSSAAPVFLDEYHASFPQEYNRVMSGVVANTLAGGFNRQGVQNMLAQAKAQMAANPAQSGQIIDQVLGWMNSFAEVANSKPEVDPDREALDREKQEWSTQKQKEESERFEASYRESSGSQAVESTHSQFSELLGDSFKKLDSDVKETITRDVFRRINAEAVKDADYMRQIKSAIGRKDQNAATRRFLTKFKQLLPVAAKKTLKVFNIQKTAPTARPGATPRTATPPAPQGFIQVGKAPGPFEVDRSRTTDSMIMNNQAVLKNGKKVRWVTA